MSFLDFDLPEGGGDARADGERAALLERAMVEVSEGGGGEFINIEFVVSRCLGSNRFQMLVIGTKRPKYNILADNWFVIDGVGESGVEERTMWSKMVVRGG